MGAYRVVTEHAGANEPPGVSGTRERAEAPRTVLGQRGGEQYVPSVEDDNRAREGVPNKRRGVISGQPQDRAIEMIFRVSADTGEGLRRGWRGTPTAETLARGAGGGGGVGWWSDP